jgi:hypothetical protein
MRIYELVGAGAGGRRAGGGPVVVRADGGVAVGGGAGRAGRHAAGGGVRADWAGVDADRGVLRPPRARGVPGVVGEVRGLAAARQLSGEASLCASLWRRL